jgi:hypothetical protein
VAHVEWTEREWGRRLTFLTRERERARELRRGDGRRTGVSTGAPHIGGRRKERKGRRGGGSQTDRRDQGEAGPGWQWSGCEREREREVGSRWGTNMQARVAQCQAARLKLDLNRFKI